MADFNLYHCLSPEEKKKLKSFFPFFKPPSDPWDKRIINLDVDMEDLEEISRLMKQAPQNVKRDSRW